uniref:Periviscerokinin-2 n=2 Tax=Derocalymma TaxID=344691 RepID=PVK2_DERCR|nr:RecName: Full=Periviscerokinin-2; Short=DerVe-PVK-2 [Derocalymma versicolor]P85581.1 RecName: Full=Periviscerokinin-2; Short=DerCr-PVK-2 [Derocalymma cruralis]
GSLTGLISMPRT